MPILTFLFLKFDGFHSLSSDKGGVSYWKSMNMYVFIAMNHFPNGKESEAIAGIVVN